jgi:plasmid stability protein
MAQLLVRNIESSLVKELKRRAAERGVSAEEEHRRILTSALLEDSDEFNRSFAAHLLSREETVDELPLRPRRQSTHRRVKF